MQRSAVKLCIPCEGRSGAVAWRAFLALLLAACGQAPPSEAGNPGGKILFIGDSITAGEVGGDGVGYVEQVTALLPRQYEAVNVAKIGSWAKQWEPDTALHVERAAPVLAGGDVAIAVVMLGTNDANGNLGRTHQIDFEVSLRRIIGNLLGSGVGHVYLITPPPEGTHDDETWSRLDRYREIANEIARLDDRIELAFDALAALDASDYDPSDPLHPAQSGHDKLAAGLWRAMCARLDACECEDCVVGPRRQVLVIGDAVALDPVEGRLPPGVDLIDGTEANSSIVRWNPSATYFVDRVAPWLFRGTVAAVVISLGPADVNVVYGAMGYEHVLRKTVATLLSARVERLYIILPRWVGVDEESRAKLEQYRDVTLRLIGEDERIVLGFDPQQRLAASRDAAKAPDRLNEAGGDELVAGLWAAMCDQFESCP
ncbi:MAG: SGNH/GDSL hydrolase family protein [Myxococcota bacterium]